MWPILPRVHGDDTGACESVPVSVPVVLAIDGNSLVHRSFHAHARSGHADWAVRGLLMQLLAAVDRVRPALVVMGFDDPCRSLRRERWPQYKAQRSDKLDTLVSQLATAAETMRRLGLAVVVPDGLEADDVMASAAAAARPLGFRTVIATSDRDAFALIDETTSVLRIINGGVDASPLMTAERLVLLCGVHPWQYPDYAALRGDPSDNLAGVRGVGPRTAARLLAEFGSAETAFDDLDAVGRRLGQGLARRLGAPDARETWQRNRAVMAARDDLAVTLDPARGPGLIPLPAETVREVFARHQLVWSLRDALRTLAELDEDRAPRADPGWPVPAWTPPRHPPLPPRPRVDQLALF
jgi:DNA polymerase-1